jgi:hypothetical protein
MDHFVLLFHAFVDIGHQEARNAQRIVRANLLNVRSIREKDTWTHSDHFGLVAPTELFVCFHFLVVTDVEGVGV